MIVMCDFDAVGLWWCCDNMTTSALRNFEILLLRMGYAPVQYSFPTLNFAHQHKNENYKD